MTKKPTLQEVEPATTAPEAAAVPDPFNLENLRLS